MALAEYFWGNPRPLGKVREIKWGALEADSQSFYAGQPVYLNAGAVTAVASDTATHLAGIALKDATNVTSDNIEIPILPFYPEDLWIIQTTSGGTAALPTTATIGTMYAFYVASNIAYMDIADTGNDAMIYHGPVYRASTSTAIYYAIVSFTPSACEWTSGT